MPSQIEHRGIKTAQVQKIKQREISQIPKEQFPKDFNLSTWSEQSNVFF